MRGVGNKFCFVLVYVLICHGNLALKTETSKLKSTIRSTIKQDTFTRAAEFLGLNSLATPTSNNSILRTFPNLNTYRAYRDLYSDVNSWLNGLRDTTRPRLPDINITNVWDNIPEDYITRDQQGRRGIALRTDNGSSLYCDDRDNLKLNTSGDGTMAASSSSASAILFVPEDGGSGRITLRSHSGGYLRDEDGKVRCTGSSPNDRQNLAVMLTPGPNSTNPLDYPKYMLLRNNSGSFLSFGHNSLRLRDNIDEVRNFIFNPPN